MMILRLRSGRSGRVVDRAPEVGEFVFELLDPLLLDQQHLLCVFETVSAVEVLGVF